MKKVLLVALVMVVVLTGIPVVVGMPMASCADCDQGIMTSALCLAVLASVAALFLAAATLKLRIASPQLQGRLAPLRSNDLLAWPSRAPTP